MTRTHMTASAVAFAAALAAAAPAFAAPLAIWGDDEKVTAKVTYNDAELRSTEGAAKLAFRIRMAARQVCGGDNPVVMTGAHFLRCQHKAIDQAVASLNAPLVADALGRAPSTLATR
jgi:UrcA family protein